ncbi:MAG: ABC transporter ATP-binding protein [Thermaerobacter sp.]|nr:ABC transporter ATP-binding protein [Thermaerobacter sp.]
MKQLLATLNPYRVRIAVIVGLLFIQALTTLYLPELMSKIVDNGVITGNMRYVAGVGEFMLGVTLLSVLCAVTAGLLASKTSAAFGKILRRRVFAQVQTFMPKDFEQLGTSSLTVRTTNDIMQVQQFVNMLLRMMVMAPLMAVGGIIMAIYTDARLSLIVLIIMPILAITIYQVLGRSVALFHMMQSKVDDLNRVLREHLTGVRVIRSFDRTDYELGRFNDANIALTAVSVRVYQIMAALMPILMLTMNFSTLAIIWFGGKLVSGGTMQIGSLMAFIQYVTQLMFSVMMVSAMFFMVPRAEASAQRINEVLAISPTVNNPPQPSAPGRTRGHVEFEDVTFRYPGAQTAVLSHISFRLKPGQMTALIGGTGSGKTTLISLIPRLADASSGRVLVDGVDVRALDQRVLRQKIGYAPQSAVLFSGSVAENIRFGNPDASLQHVQLAAEIAQANEFIERLPGGFDSMISQGGANLSGGQKHRLAMARALVRKAEIYIFDDTFSALDYKTDARLRAALHQATRDATVLIVSQRVSAVRDADQIIVLDDGVLAGVGTHQELMDSSETYRQIVTSQRTEEGTA